MTRLNKFIAECGVTSRRKAEDLILQGRVTINNTTITTLSFEVDPHKDEIAVDGEKIKPAEHVYFLLNKPKGVVTTTDDEKGRVTVNDILKTKQKIFPVGRLDYNTTGVIILTNDGEFANKILHPRNNVIREYEVKLDRDLELQDKEKLLKGIFIENKRGTFITVEYSKKNDRTNVTVRCTEGRNHFVKKMFGALKYRVEKLHRKSFAGIKADIPIGVYRKLTTDELHKLSRKN